MIYVNPNWTYGESVEHIQALKDEYDVVLSSFSMWETGKKADYCYSVRDQFYRLKLFEWQIEYLWKYMNGYIDIHKLIMSINSKNRQKKR